MRKTALVTGGVSGIGLASVEAFLAAGFAVVCADVQDTKGALMHNRLGEDFAYVHCDVTLEADVIAAVATALARFGRLDVMFNNAGLPGVDGSIADISVDGFDRAVAVNVRGVFLGMKHAAPHLIRQRSGSIINTASAAGIIAGDAAHIYSMTKAAVIHLTKCVAMELAEHGVRVNAIAPGLVPTAIVGRALGLDVDAADATVDALRSIGESFAPLPGGTLPADIAAAAVFLASDAAAKITGIVLPVDGGLTAGARWSKARAGWSQIAKTLGVTMPA